MSEVEKGSYADLLIGIKARVQTARIRAGLAVNQELIQLYWDIGKLVAERQNEEGWSSSVIDRLSADVRREFPDLKGFSSRNIWRMKSFYLAYRDEVIKLPQAAAVIGSLKNHELPDVFRVPWYHNVILLEKVKDPEARRWYLKKTIEHGWSRNILALHIDQGDYERKGQAVSNYHTTLPSPQSDLAHEILKDPYIFDFLGIADDAREREVENALLEHLRDFLIELGDGFAFVGNQVRLRVDDDDYYIDLLFYHLKLRCYFVIDLKTRPFVAGDAGQMNFYLNAVDDQLRHPDDQPSLGLVLCRKKKGSNKMLLEYALRGLDKPVGVSAYELTRALPDDLKPTLPSVEEIESELAEKIDPSDSSETGMMVREWAEEYKTRVDE